MLPFSGPATPLSASDLADIAESIGCDLATFRAVMTVESGGSGFLSDGSGRPRILFEAAVFSRLTGGRFNAAHPYLSAVAANWGLYRGGAAEYGRLSAAMELDRDAALKATSWGLFQIMGENAEACGFADVNTYVAAMARSERSQAMAFAKFLLLSGCLASLKVHNWAEFARRYNGPLYAQNFYDTKLAAAYALATGVVDSDLRIGASGPLVARLQTALSVRGYQLKIDASFGRLTELALMRFQQANGLDPDGVVGPRTAAALALNYSSETV